MAKRIVDEEMRFSIVVNGDPAQKELHEVQLSTRKLQQEQAKLRREKKRLEKAGKQESARYKEVRAEMERNTAQIQKYNAKITELEKKIGITGLTMAQLQKRAAELRIALRHSDPNHKQYKILQNELKATSARMSELRMKAQGAKMSIRSLADGFNRYAAMGAAVIATGTGIALTFSKLIDFQGELSDAQGDVMKTTGLTKDEVDELTKSLGDLNTRTSRMELLALATEAGRLGIEGVDNVKAFVETANLLKVALGDELSDEAIREVGKMANIFRVGDQTGRDFGESMQSLGSAINHVSASGANQASFLVDFMKRTAGVSNLADVSADKVLGIAAAFDELGQSQEISATALNKTLLSMGDDVGKFANAAGVSTEKLSKLLKEDANEALMVFLEGIGRGNPSLEVMSQRLEGIELGGTRGVQAMAALSQNLDLVRKRQNDANQALLANTSLMDEYNIKNENTAALLAKIRRRVMGIFASETITNGIADFLNWFAKFIGATEDAEGGVTRFRDRLMFLLKAFTVVVVAIFSYNAAVAITAAVTGTAHSQTLLYNVALKAKNIITAAATALTRSYAITKALLTGKIKLATAAQKLFNIAVRNNPIGIIIALLAAATTAYIAFSKSTSDASRQQRMMNDVRSTAAKSIAKEKNELENLLKVAKDEKRSKEDRENAIKRLNKISPEYLGNLDSENIKTKEGLRLVEDYVKALEKKALAQAAENKQIELQQKLIDVQMKTTDEYKSSLEEFGDDTVGKIFDKIFGETEKLNIRSREDLENYLKESDFSDDLANTIRKTYDNIFEAKDKELKQIEDDIKSLNKFMNKNIVLEPQEPETVEQDTIDTSSGTGKTDPTSFKLENLLREREAVAKLRKENYDLEVNQIDDAFWREMMLLESNHEEKMRRLRAQKVEEAEIAKTQGLLDQAVKEDLNGSNQEAIDNYTKVLQIWKQKNEEIDEQIRLQKVAHQEDVGKLVQEGIEMEIQALEASFLKQKQIKEKQRLEDLAEVAHSQRKTNQLKEQFRKEDLEDEKKHVEKLKNIVQEIWDTKSFEDFDLELLTQEQKDQIVARLQELGLELSEINLLLAQMQNGGKSTDVLGDIGLGGQTDILGFTPEQWEHMFTNFNTFEEKLAGIVMGVQAMTNAYAMFSDFQSQKDQDRLRSLERNHQRERDALQQKLDAGYINERQHADAVAALAQQLEDKKEEIAKKQAKREKIMALASIATNTAVAIMGIWKDFPKADFGATAAIMTGVVSALGAAQAAMVMSTKGYQDGFYGDKFPVRREQDGKMFNAGFGGESRSGIVNQPTMFLAGEQGKTAPEMIISGGDYAKLTPDLKDTLNRQLGSVRGYQDGFYPENKGDAMSSEEFKTVLALNFETLNKLNAILSNGILAKVIANEANARELEEALEKYRKRKQSSKI